MSFTRFLQGEGAWQSMYTITSKDSGFPRNHNSGIMRDSFGHIKNWETPTIYFTVSKCAPDVEQAYGKHAEWTYNIYKTTIKKEEYTVYKEKPSKKKKIVIAIISITMCFVLAFGIYIFTLFTGKKEYTTVSSYASISQPIQQNYSNEITTTLGDYNITYKIKATYSISGKVVEKYYYTPFGIVNKIMSIFIFNAVILKTLFSNL